MQVFQQCWKLEENLTFILFTGALYFSPHRSLFPVSGNIFETWNISVLEYVLVKSNHIVTR